MKPMKFYQQGLEIAESREDWGEAYYHSINLAFLALLAMDDRIEMKSYAKKALEFLDREEGEEGLA